MTATRRSAYTRARRVVQASVAAVYLLLPLAAGRTAATAGTLASLKVGPLDLTEPAAALSAVLASRSAHVTLSLVVGTLPLLVLALHLGPVFCSWACPWGLLSEGLDAARQRVHPRAWPADSWRPLRRPRALALLALELVGPRRVWCRALCPVGALLNVVRAPRQLRPVFDETLCLCPKVAACHQRCAWGVDPRRMGRFDGCSNCLACVEGCPSRALAAARPRPGESSSGLAVPGTRSG